MKFKNQWTPELQSYASDMEQQYRLPEGSLHQLIKMESAGYTDALSKAGARGLTQLMPGTAKQMGVSDINNPYQQIEGGAKYYSQMLEKAQGNPIVAAGMYNSGPNRKAYTSGHLNMLPVETQNYMRKFATEFGGYQPSQTVPEKIMNAIISPAYGSSRHSSQGSKTNASSGELTPDQFAALKPASTSSGELTPDQFAALKPASTSSGELTPDQFAALKPAEPPAKIKSYDQAIPERTVSQALGEAVSNFPSSFIENAKATGQAILNPEETVPALANILTGEIQKVIPGKSPAELLGIVDKVSPEAADEFNKNVMHRYGGYQNVLNTLATDPVGLLSDLSFKPGTSAVKKAIKDAYNPLSPVPIIRDLQIANPSRQARNVNLMTDTGVGLITSPGPTLAGGLLDVSGKLGKEFLSVINRSGISKADIEAAYKGEPGSVSKQPFTPENLSGAGALLGLLGATSLTPASLLALSPKSVAFGVAASGDLRRFGSGIPSGYENIPLKGSLREYGRNKQDENK